MSSMLHSMNVVREVPVRLLSRSTVKINQKRTMPITTQLFMLAGVRAVRG